MEEIRLIGHPRVSREKDRVDILLPAGLPLDAYLRRVWIALEGIHVRVVIDGQVIDRAEWGTYVVRPGQVVTARAIPLGGEGGKSALRIVALLGVVALSIFTAGGGLAGVAGLFGGGAFGGAAALGFGVAGSLASGLAAAAISVAGTLAINMLIPPPRPRLGDLSGGGDGSPTLSLTGSSNAFAPYAPIPRVYGTHRIYPPLAGRTFTEIVGSDQYLRLLFCFGYGPLDLRDFRIGTTPLDQFTDVEMEIRYGYDDDAPLTLFANDVFEDPLSIVLTTSFQQRNSQLDANELSVDVTFPSGLGAYNNQGGLRAYQVTVTVEYRKVGTVPWLPVEDPIRTASRETAFAGANNDLLFTAKQAGAIGNQITVVYNKTVKPASVSASQTVLRGQQVVSARTINIYVIEGSTTASAVKTLLEANATIASWVTIAHAAGNNGSGTFQVFQVTNNNRSISVTYQLQGGRDAIPAFVAQGPTSKQLRLSRRFSVPELGEYEVQLKKTDVGPPDPNDIQVLNQVAWTALRTIHNVPPAMKRGLCFVALRIKATGQLNGTVDQFNALATSILFDWNGTEWAPAPTSNPASIYRDVLQGQANRRPKTDAQLDMPAIQAFHAKCTENGFYFNAVIDFATTVKQLRQDVLAAGRGTFHLFDMKYSVLYEKTQDTSVHLISSRNSFNPQWQKRFIEVPHALRVRYVDEDSDYRQNERIVYADGYSAATATIFEDGEAGLGVTHEQQVWKMKRRELAEVQLRADDYIVEMDFEHLLFTRGDRVEQQTDLVLAALSSGRLRSVTLDGNSLVTACTVDEPVVMVAGTTYGIRIRMASGVHCVGKLVTQAGTQSSLTFSPPIPGSAGVAIGDLYTVGLFGQESLPRIVTSIRPGADHRATVTLQDYAPAIMQAESIPIPAYEGNVTSPQVDRLVLAPPIVERVQSDEAVLVRALDGALQSRILITVSFPSGFRIPPDRVEAQFRPTGSEAPWIQLGAAVDGTNGEIALVPVEDGRSYDFHLRSVDRTSGVASTWTQTQAHVVIGKTSKPPDITVIVIEDDRLRWNYENPPRDLAGFKVRYRSGSDRDWGDATPAHDGLILTTDFTAFRGVGFTTFLVKAVDVAGNESVNPGAVTINFGNTLVANVVITTDHRALGWPGTKTNGTVIANQLQANSSTPFWTVNSAKFWSGVNANLFWTASYGTMTYQFSVSPPIDLLDATLKLSMTVLGDWTVIYRPDSSALMWHATASVPMWTSDSALMWQAKSGYTQWPGQLAPLLRQAYDFTVTTKAGNTQGVLDQLSVILDVPDLLEYLNNQVIASGGTRLPIVKSFRAITAVRVDLQSDGGTAAYLKVMDKNLDLHPLVQAFDSSNITTSALIDAVVQGY